MSAPLELTATAAGDTFAVGAAIPVRLRLANRSVVAVQVNGRLGVGYQDGLYREVYFTVRDSAGQVLPVPDSSRVDAHRLPPGKDDFQLLEPGESVTGELDLALWYPFVQPGDYLVELHYQNSDDGAAFGLAAFTGRVDADALRLRLTD
ncbi:MAG TPA: hypothetical protein VJ851_13525 [Jatrophihabitans sp.]|nr:hypothetical protein [Jatrophihabitans sp.]